MLARAHRTGLGLLALGLATKVPYFSYVMAFIGSFLTLTVSVIFPSLCYLKLYGKELSRCEVAGNYLVVGLGALCAVCGSVVALDDLLEVIQSSG